MNKHEVAGGWVVLRDPKAVPERLRRPILLKGNSIAKQSAAIADGSVEAANIDEETLSGMFAFNDLLAVALISEWSFPDAITVEGLGNLPGKTYDEIQRVVAPLVTAVMPDFEPSPEEDSPTEPSDA